MTLKLKRTPALYLVGFMCCGKTSVGQELAEHLGWGFIDLDAEIEAQAGEPVRAIFRSKGEAAFREIETETLRQHVTRIEAGHPCVLALGGGTFVQQQNWEIIENNGVTVWLDCTLDTVLQRLGEDQTRPLAQDRNELAQLYGDRRPLYSRADFRIDVDTDEIATIVKKILGLPIF